jgi:hypothetical protein
LLSCCSIDRRKRLGLKPLQITLIRIILVSDSSGLSRWNLLLRLICSAKIYLLRRTSRIAVLLVLSWSFLHSHLDSDRFPVGAVQFFLIKDLRSDRRMTICITGDRGIRCLAPRTEAVFPPATPRAPDRKSLLRYGDRGIARPGITDHPKKRILEEACPSIGGIDPRA